MSLFEKALLVWLRCIHQNLFTTGLKLLSVIRCSFREGIAGEISIGPLIYTIASIINWIIII